MIGLIVLRLGGAPGALVALAAAMAAGLATSLLVTLSRKLSIHAAVVAGSDAILVLVFGPWLLALTPVVILVRWPACNSASTRSPKSSRELPWAQSSQHLCSARSRKATSREGG